MKVNKLVDGINALIGKRDTKLYFYGVDYNMGPLWILDGITPVGADCAIDVLGSSGKKVAHLRKLFKQQEAIKKQRWDRKQRLIARAYTKLTPAEIHAVST